MDKSKILPFEKWHGTGNDFVICSQQRTMEFTEDVSSLAKAICSRHFGVGSDGLILIGRSEKADFRMRMWNPDGSEAEMCANGLRCVGMHLLGHGRTDGSAPLTIETAKRIVRLEFIKPPDWAAGDVTWVRVNMGKPVLERAEIPMAGAGKSPVVEEEMTIPDSNEVVKITAVNFGNPHAVIFVEDVDKAPLHDWGSKIENFTDVFPDRVNVEIVQVISGEHVRMRVWERGVGETLSCGSGTAAVQTACRLTGKAGDFLRIDTRGGSLVTEYSEESVVHLSGPAVRAFEGEWVGRG